MRPNENKRRRRVKRSYNHYDYKPDSSSSESEGENWYANSKKQKTNENGEGCSWMGNNYENWRGDEDEVRRVNERNEDFRRHLAAQAAERAIFQDAATSSTRYVTTTNQPSTLP